MKISLDRKRQKDLGVTKKDIQRVVGEIYDAKCKIDKHSTRKTF